MIADRHRLQADRTCTPMLLGRGAAPKENKLARTPTFTPPSKNSLRQATAEDVWMIRAQRGDLSATLHMAWRSDADGAKR